jgi:hypothetical protein
VVLADCRRVLHEAPPRAADVIAVPPQTSIALGVTHKIAKLRSGTTGAAGRSMAIANPSISVMRD